MSDRDLFRHVALHFLMGAILGTLLVTLLLVLNVRSVSDIVLRSTNPIANIFILVAGASLYFAFGAAITGLHFLIVDENHPTGGHR